MIEGLHINGITIMEPQYNNIGLFDRTKLKRCLYHWTNPNMIIGPYVTTPYIQMMHFGIMKIWP